MTLVLVLLMGAVYLAAALASGTPWRLPPATLHAFGALITPLPSPGQAFRLLTTLFIHVDPWHLGGNAGLLLLLGKGLPRLGFRGLERIIGGLPLLLCFLLGGLAGSLLDLLAYSTGPTLCAGASGALLALLPCGLTLPRGLVPRPWKAVLLLCTVALLLSGVLLHGDNAAHAGGLLFGALIAPWLRRRRLE